MADLDIDKAIEELEEEIEGVHDEDDHAEGEKKKKKKGIFRRIVKKVGKLIPTSTKPLSKLIILNALIFGITKIEQIGDTSASGLSANNPKFFKRIYDTDLVPEVGVFKDNLLPGR